MLEVKNLTKQYRGKTVVDNISFTVENGHVTGFLGPNGSGKTTTMRLLLGLERPTSGTALIDGKKFAQHVAPLATVGALLDAKALHPKRTAYAHLQSLALTHGIPKRRVDEVIELTGLASVAKKAVRGFSLGMGQRLGIAVALLGDPQNVILDEPVNGLDPEGVKWVRDLAKYLAEQGKAVLISSHLMSEMEQTADNLVVIGRGKLLTQAPMQEFLQLQQRKIAFVRTSRRDELAALLTQRGNSVTVTDVDALLVEGASARDIAEIAYTAGVLVYELTPQIPSLEDVYLQMTQSEVEYKSGQLVSTLSQQAVATPASVMPSAQPVAAQPATSDPAVQGDGTLPQAQPATMFKNEERS